MDGSSDPREQRRALALVMIIEGFSYLKTQKILNVSSSFISQCKTRFATHGIDGWKLGYKGGVADLRDDYGNAEISLEGTGVSQNLRS